MHFGDSRNALDTHVGDSRIAIGMNSSQAGFASRQKYQL
jgi:hypothetical protein